MTTKIGNIVNTVEMFRETRKGKYAIPALNSHNLETIQIVDANDSRKYTTPGMIAMKEVLVEKILMCGSNGKA